jgi:hypothetical protein
METVVGVFELAEDAERAAAALRRAGIPMDHVNVLRPGLSEPEIHAVPTTDTEQPGMGAAAGGVVGGATGASMGPIAASLLVPGVGPVIAVGTAAMALLGLAGAAVGALAGAKLEEAVGNGLPKDELFFYEEMLRQGRSIVIAITAGGEQAESARRVLAESGAEDLDAAREHWWIGLRDVHGLHREIAGDEGAYRRGFETALHHDNRGRSCDDAALRARTAAESDAFRRGYERGQAYHRDLAGRRRT